MSIRLNHEAFRTHETTNEVSGNVIFNSGFTCQNDTKNREGPLGVRINVHTTLYGRSSFSSAPLLAPKCVIYYVCLEGEESSQSVGVTAAVAVGILNHNPLDPTAEK
jgi:hypothetical protein